MNKAQKEFVLSYYNDPFFDRPFVMTEKTLLNFAERYGAINSEPDNLYVMMYKGITGKWGVNHPETFTKEEADEKLHNLMTESLDYVSEYRAGEYLKLLFSKEEDSQEWTQEFRIDHA